jgi:AcrR family transcriptional regulator
MGYRHDREDILHAATAVLAESGLAGLTFRAVGERLGIADRTVVYYFPTKEGLVVAVVERAVDGLRQVLADALGDARGDERALAGRAWQALRSPAGDGFRLALEVLGLAARGVKPYRTATAAMVEAWIGFVAERLTWSDVDRRDRAAGVVALLEGLALIQAVAGTDAADRAARGLGLPLL